jgi:DNA polymerase-3 subunit epsilon
MLILGLDFETSGLDPAKDRIIEAGAVLWHWETKTPLQLLSALILPPNPISEEITKITGITNEMLSRYGHNETDVMRRFDEFLGWANCAMAHSATSDFDKVFYDHSCARTAIPTRDIIWVNTAVDIVYDERITTRNLQYLAADHSFVNPWRHRAVFDVLTMLRIASDYDLEKMIARAREPMVYVQALVSYDQRELAKARGYWWHPQLKIWWKPLKLSDSVIERETCGFRTSMLLNKPEDTK